LLISHHDYYKYDGHAMFWEQDNTITILIHKPVYFITIIQLKINNIMDVSPDTIYFFTRTDDTTGGYHHCMFCWLSSWYIRTMRANRMHCLLSIYFRN